MIEFMGEKYMPYYFTIQVKQNYHRYSSRMFLITTAKHNKQQPDA